MFLEFVSLFFCVIVLRLFIIFFKKEKPTNLQELNDFMIHFILTCIIYLILKYLF